jgi:hypothetical protein
MIVIFSPIPFHHGMSTLTQASEDRKSMIFGGTLGFVLITIAVMLFGLGGWLAAWAGHINWSTNGNLFLFQVMRDELILYGAPPPPYEAPVYGPPNMPSHPPPGFPPLAPIAPPYAPPYAPYNYHGQSAKLSSWIGLITLVLAVVMNEGAIDSLQNGKACISMLSPDHVRMSQSTLLLNSLLTVYLRHNIVHLNPLLPQPAHPVDAISCHLHQHPRHDRWHNGKGR